MSIRNEIIERLENLAEHAVHRAGEPPFVMSLDDGIALHEAIELLKAQEPREMSDAELMDAIRKAPIIVKPTVDAAPVKCGQWTERHVDYASDCAIDEVQTAKCSVCGLYHTTPYLYSFTDFKFCPNCGAKMKGVRTWEP